MIVRIIENKSEIGAGTRGASLGIDALRIAALNKKSNYFKLNHVTTIKDWNNLLLEEVKNEEAIRIEGIVKVFDTISSKVGELLEEGIFPLILASDHASAGGTIAGIKKTYPTKRLGVIWIDAHADLHSPFTTPSGNVHGMPLATAINEDNVDFKINNINEEVLKHWTQLKECHHISPKISTDDIVFYGVRDTEKPEDALIEKYNIKNFTVAECRKKGMEAVSEEGLNILKDCDILYISFDVDSMDCDLVSMGTGTPVPNGFSPSEVDGLLNRLVQSEKLVCFEMVEINPTLDNKQNKMAETAMDILENVTTVLHNKKV